MPRGADYVDGPPVSDNAIDAGEDKIAGAPQGSDVSFFFDKCLHTKRNPDGDTRDQQLLEWIVHTKQPRYQRVSAK